MWAVYCAMNALWCGTVLPKLRCHCHLVQVSLIHPPGGTASIPPFLPLLFTGCRLCSCDPGRVGLPLNLWEVWGGIHMLLRLQILPGPEEKYGSVCACTARAQLRELPFALLAAMPWAPPRCGEQQFCEPKQSLSKRVARVPNSTLCKPLLKR